MKKSRFIPLLFVFIAVFVASCEKEDPATSTNSNNTTNTTTNISKLDKVYRNGTLTATYTYDAQGRCIKEDFVDATIKYEYSTNKVVATKESVNSQSVVSTYTLNEKGLATVCHFTTDKPRLKEYEYNADKQLIKEISKSKLANSNNYGVESTITYTYNSNGDCSQELRSGSETLYDYDSNLPNVLDMSNKGLEWLGKRSVHLFKDELIVTTFNGIVRYYTTNTTWSYNAATKTLKQTSKGDFPVEKTYVFR